MNVGRWFRRNERIQYACLIGAISVSVVAVLHFGAGKKYLHPVEDSQPRTELSQTYEK